MACPYCQGGGESPKVPLETPRFGKFRTPKGNQGVARPRTLWFGAGRLLIFVFRVLTFSLYLRLIDCMTKFRLPIPVLMLALTGALMLFSVLAEHLPSTASAAQGGQRTIASEVQPAALTYFRVMDWLAQFMPSGSGKTAAAPAAAPSARLMDRSGRTPSTPMRLCSLHVRANSSGGGRVSTAATRSMFVSASAEN